MDNRVKYGILVVVGGVGVYLIWKGGYFQQWFPSLFGSSATPSTKPTGSGQSADCTALAQKVGGVSKVMANDPNLQRIRGIVTFSADQEAMLTACGGLDLTASQLSAIQSALKTPALPPAPSPPAATTPTPCPPGYHRANNWDPNATCLPPASAPLPTYCDLNTPGWSIQNGVCALTPAQQQTVSEQMVALAGKSDGLDMDEWAYYFTQVTGQPSPRDPGDIIAAAGDNPPSFPQGRATQMDIGTWLAFMNQDGAGISGLAGLAALRVANAWLT